MFLVEIVSHCNCSQIWTHAFILCYWSGAFDLLQGVVNLFLISVTRCWDRAT